MDLTPVPNVAFASSACFSCYRAPPDTTPLKRCSGCKRVKFCSTTCSKAEWKDHKPFCLAFSALRSRDKATLPPLYDDASESDIASRRETQRAQWALEDDLLSVALGRPQTLLEGKLLWREPRCAVCWDREADVEAREGENEWATCTKCRVVSWCGKSHKEADREHHLLSEGPDGMTQCQAIRLSNEIDEFFLRHHLASPEEPPHLWIPSEPLSEPPKSWLSYLQPRLLPSPTPSAAQIHGVFLEALSPILTLYSALPQPFISDHLSIHIIDPSPTYTGLHLPAYEELLHLLPSVKTFDLYLIGPSVPSALSTAPAFQNTCVDCKKQSRSRSAHWIPCTDHIRLPPSVPSRPNLIAGFSPSMSEDPKYWKSILERAMGDKISTVFTAKTEEEAADDISTALEVLRLPTEQIISGPRRNTWAGGRPNVDFWEEDGVWRENAWVWSLDFGATASV